MGLNGQSDKKRPALQTNGGRVSRSTSYQVSMSCPALSCELHNSQLEAGSSKLLLEIERNRHLRQPRSDHGARCEPRVGLGACRIPEARSADGGLIEQVVKVQAQVRAGPGVLENLPEPKIELVDPIVVRRLRRDERQVRR